MCLHTVSRAGALALLPTLLITGCTHPSTGPAGGTGNTGNNGTGNTSGTSGGSNGQGSGGRMMGSSGGGEVIITGSGGNGGGAVIGSGGAPPGACIMPSYMDAYAPGYVRDMTIANMATSMLGGMSIADKAGQMRGTDPGPGGGQFNDIFRTADNTARGVKGFLFRDGPRGVNLDAPTLSGTQRGRSTVFPVSMARAATWDLELERQIGAAMGDEMVAVGQTMLLVPTTNILRHPLWGRAQETYGEDPFQLGRFGSALIAGLQQYVPGCAKHYAANNIEQGRANLNAQMDERTLHEMYARHFGMMIKDAGVACIMAAYNAVNGTKSTQNSHLLNDILRTDFGFTGFVLSDWWAMPGGSTPSLATAARQTNAAQAVQAGLDMEVPWSLNYSVLESITGTSLTQQVIDQATARIIEQKLRFRVASLSGPIGLKTVDPNTMVTNGSVRNSAHINLALQAARESMVLLKNANNTLPIRRGGTIRSIAVVGTRQSYTITNTTDDPNGGTVDFPTTVRTGDVGSSRVNNDPALSVDPTAGIRMAAGAGITVTSGNAVATAQAADFVVVVAGLTPQDEGEEYTGAGDRTSFALDAKANAGAQNNLIMQVAALGKPMVVVLEGGSVIDMPWLANVPAVVMAWYPGMVGGRALGELLFGDQNFSGKLPITWGASLAQYPTFNAGTSTMMDYDIGYRRFDRNNTTPLFRFGYGLSYTTYAYANVQVCGPVTIPATEGTPAHPANNTTYKNLTNAFVNVTAEVTNTGTVAGNEVALLFVQFPNATNHAVRELKGWYRVQLDAGITKRITIPVRLADLAYYDMASSSWKIETGQMRIFVGKSSDPADLPMAQSATLMLQ